MSLKYSKQVKALGHVLNRFNTTDTRRIGSMGQFFVYYVAKDGRIGHKFERLEDVARWVESRQGLLSLDELR